MKTKPTQFQMKNGIEMENTRKRERDGNKKKTFV